MRFVHLKYGLPPPFTRRQREAVKAAAAAKAAEFAAAKAAAEAEAEANGTGRKMAPKPPGSKDVSSMQPSILSACQLFRASKIVIL